MIKLEMETRGGLPFPVFCWSQINHFALCMDKAQPICTDVHLMTQHAGEIEGLAGAYNSSRL